MQQFYVIQVRVGYERKFIANFYKHCPELESTCILKFPERMLFIRRQGKQLQELQPVFSGYVFIVTETLNEELIAQLKKEDNFIRFLPRTNDVMPLSGNDLTLIKRFTDFGEVLGPSKVYFNENDRIVVTEGPLLGQEGSIIKVDRRKKRAKIQLQFAENTFTIDLSFEVIETKA